jgi:hypothetical protein
VWCGEWDGCREPRVSSEFAAQLLAEVFSSLNLRLGLGPTQACPRGHSYDEQIPTAPDIAAR